MGSDAKVCGVGECGGEVEGAPDSGSEVQPEAKRDVLDAWGAAVGEEQVELLVSRMDEVKACMETLKS